MSAESEVPPPPRPAERKTWLVPLGLMVLALVAIVFVVLPSDDDEAEPAIDEATRTQLQAAVDRTAIRSALEDRMLDGGLPPKDTRCILSHFSALSDEEVLSFDARTDEGGDLLVQWAEECA